MCKVLTITIPCYNVEQFLEETLQSFVDPRILEDIEVLIVDDGSEDRSAEIGRTFQDKFPETFRVISKVNGGHGSTINKGIEEGCGRYFKVVDGDDWVNTEEFVELVRRLKKCDADYVVTDYYEVDDVTKKKTRISYSVLANEELQLFNEIAHKTQINMHALVIKMSILKEHHIRIDENRFYVDVEYILFPIPYIETVEYISLCVYEYRLAQAAQSVSIQGYQKHMQNHIDVIMHLSQFLEDYIHSNKENIKANYIAKRIAQMVGDQVTVFMSFGPNNRKVRQKFIEFDRELKSVSPTVYELSAKESGALSILRKSKFIGYGSIVIMSQIRNRKGDKHAN